MNPVLLKPETDVGAQIIVHGRPVATLRARAYAAMKPSLMAPVLENFARLQYDQQSGVWNNKLELQRAKILRIPLTKPSATLA
ncbi:hypothetical protein CQ12_18565 [Bradyrhizobium jicamae]|uniref:Uncharacterized protein n=1 Tax=Bradyrhizobium jicamae TaxID=280332 RepID=A0A0R3L2Z9_9BRAD|nr:hypothetical protein CQ12_18565 [Bradyrhizobium jicamae]